MSEVEHVAEVSADYLPAGELVSVGYKRTEVGVIPEDWELSDIKTISAVPMQNGLFYEPKRKGSGVPLINVSDMYESAPIDVDCLELFDATPNEVKVFRATCGDLFFTRSSVVPSGIAFCNIFDSDRDEVVFDSHLIRVRPNREIVEPRYLYLNCISKHARIALISEAKTATMTTIDQGAINRCPVLLPPKLEQTAIANALSDVDELLKSLEKLIAKQQAIKTATIQQLLTGKTRLPAFAFREDGTRKGYKDSELGEIPEDWEVKTILELANYQKALFDDGDWVEAEHITSDGIRLIQTGNIGIGCFVEKETKKYIFEESFELLHCKELKIGDILICRLAEPAGRACVFPDIGESRVITSVDVTIFRPRKDIASREYLVQYFSSSKWFESVLEQVGGTTHKRISRGALGKILLPYPTHSEQAIIATILSDMDSEIQTLEKRLSKTRKIKQGMMQELLTGKTRLVKPEATA